MLRLEVCYANVKLAEFMKKQFSDCFSQAMISSMSSMLEDSAAGGKQVALAGAASLRKRRLNCGPGM